MSANETIAHEQSRVFTPGELCASARIRDARRALAELVLKNDLAFGGTLLLGNVAERLDAIMLELESLAGLQKLFELWIDTKDDEPDEA